MIILLVHIFIYDPMLLAGLSNLDKITEVASSNYWKLFPNEKHIAESDGQSAYYPIWGTVKYKYCRIRSAQLLGTKS